MKEIIFTYKIKILNKSDLNNLDLIKNAKR